MDEAETGLPCKKVENNAHAVALYFMFYNYCRPHMTLTKEAGRPTTPAMAAGKVFVPWGLEEIAALVNYAQDSK